ncbi:MAG: fibronectin type III-like domain-contianing protein, partial [Thermomicrobiales bacterium]
DPGSTPVTVKATVTNTGKRAGAEVVQVYLELPEGIGQPPRRLVGFQKVLLEPGASQTVEIVVDPAGANHPLSAWSYGARGFVIPDGTFTVHVGASSADTMPAGTFTVSGQ